MPVYSDLFMDKAVVFIKLYFPVFLLGALFGKVIELSGFARSITSSVIHLAGRQRAVLAIVLVCSILTYGGVSLFVVVFAVYPFAAELFRQGHLPKRLIPGTIALGAFTLTMDALPGTPQIQNVIPTSFFGTDIYAAPILGTLGGAYILLMGMLYLNWRLRQAMRANEGYGTGHTNEPEQAAAGVTVHPLVAILPLLVVGVSNWAFTKHVFPAVYMPDPTITTTSVTLAGLSKPIDVAVKSMIGIWSVEVALVLGILTVLAFAFRTVASRFAEGSKQAIAGSLLAAVNTASEYGFGAVIAALPGFLVIRDALKASPTAHREA